MIIAAVQNAIYTRLSEYEGLTGVPIYDHVPQDVRPEDKDKFPFITIGEDSYEVADTDTENWLDVSLTVNVWSRYGGRMEAKGIQDHIRGALHRYALPVDGATTIILDMESASCLRQEDGLTYHGSQDFRLLLEEWD